MSRLVVVESRATVDGKVQDWQRYGSPFMSSPGNNIIRHLTETFAKYDNPNIPVTMEFRLVDA